MLRIFVQITYLMVTQIDVTYWNVETVAWMCPVKKVFLEILQIYRKTPVPESLFLINIAWGLQLYQIETLAQVFSSEFCKISKNFFSYRTPPVAASENVLLIFPMIFDQCVRQCERRLGHGEESLGERNLYSTPVNNLEGTSTSINMTHNLTKMIRN